MKINYEKVMIFYLQFTRVRQDDRSQRSSQKTSIRNLRDTIRKCDDFVVAEV